MVLTILSQAVNGRVVRHSQEDQTHVDLPHRRRELDDNVACTVVAV